MAASETMAEVGMEAIQNDTDYLGAFANNFRRTDPHFRYLDARTATDIRNLGVSDSANE